MASPRTRSLIKAQGSFKRCGAAIRARNRLQQEAILLHRGITEAQARLAEIDAEEEIHSAVILTEGDVIAEANKPPPEPGAS